MKTNNTGYMGSEMDVLMMTKESPFCQEFYKKNPKLRITKSRDWAYLDFGNLRIYFCGKKETKKYTNSGVELEQTIIPFDGIEISMNNDES